MLGDGLITANGATIRVVREGRKLDIGAGAKRDPDFETMDISPVYDPDFQHDLTRFPWPFADGEFDGVRCHHVLEHIERKHLIAVMNEMHRILKPGGNADIEVPVFPYWTAIADPTHVSFFVLQTFWYFCKGSFQGNDYAEQRALYGVKEWKLGEAFKSGMGDILRVGLVKPDYATGGIVSKDALRRID